jgi:hypothetical protein
MINGRKAREDRTGWAGGQVRILRNVAEEMGHRDRVSLSPLSTLDEGAHYRPGHVGCAVENRDA